MSQSPVYDVVPIIHAPRSGKPSVRIHRRPVAMLSFSAGIKPQCQTEHPILPRIPHIAGWDTIGVVDLNHELFAVYQREMRLG